MAAPQRIPFDSLTLAAVVCEARELVGAKLQKILQTDESTVVLVFYSHGSERGLLLSCDARFFRVHLTRALRKGLSPPPPFCQTLRKALTDTRLAEVGQVGFDRILKLTFSTPNGPYCLIAELMGKHSNLILVGPDGKASGAAKWVGPSKSRRPVLPNRAYEAPPFAPRPTVWEAETWEALRASEGASPFLAALLARSVGLADAPVDGPLPAGAVHLLRAWKKSTESGEFEPQAAPGIGAYPAPVRALFETAVSAAGLSAALDAHYSEAVQATAIGEARSALLGQLRRVLAARESAVISLEEASDTARRAGEFQRMGELLIGIQHSAPSGVSKWETQDWEGNPVAIPLNPDLSPLENAQRLFDRAKKAKSRAGEVREQLERQRSDLREIESLIADVACAESLEGLTRMKEAARARRWLIAPTSAAKEDRPFEGHRIRELIGPGGWPVLYGENATSNDYLTQRVAKPNDWWLHVRGVASSHVVIRTSNRPERVPRETLEFAAKIAAAHSAAKHSSLVAVDYTLRKYVRKPKGAPPGTVLCEREKTLHVSGG